jgi:hypothetical protein
MSARLGSFRIAALDVERPSVRHSPCNSRSGRKTTPDVLYGGVDLVAKGSDSYPVKVLKTVPLAVLSLLVSSSGCNKILGIEEKHFASGGSSGDGGAGGQKNDTCALTENKSAAIRVMNALPKDTALDLCVKPTTGKDFGEPWFKSGGAACGEGVKYTQFTSDLGIDAGEYDFKLIAAGGKCTGTGLEIRKVTLVAGQSLTLLAYGPDLAGGEVTAHENRSAQGLNIPIRFVHAMNTDQRLTLGLAKESTLPTSLTTPIFLDVERGGVAAPSTGGPTTVDDVVENGYTLLAGGETSRPQLSLGLISSERSEVSLVVPLPVATGHAYTVFALGVPNSVEQRPRLWTCDESESDGLFLDCGNPIDVSFEAFNPNLADAFTSYITERTSPAMKAIVAEETDVLCVAELYNPKVKEQLAGLTPSRFGYRVFSDDVPADKRTPMPPRQDGSAPEYPPIACPPGIDVLFSQFLQCGMTASESSDVAGPPCTTADAQGEHYLSHPGDIATTCFSNHCSDVGLSLMTADPSGIGVVCYMCGLTHLSSYESFEATERACTATSEHPEHLAFAGTSGLAVFSVYPLGEPEVVLLPSTGWQRAAMRVPVRLPNGTVVDHWCGSLRFPNAEVELPYAGQYGGSASGSGSIAEQSYQIDTLVNAVQKRHETSGTPAVVGLVAYNGPERKDADGNVLVYGQVPENYSKLEGAWSTLVASDYVPACTYCGDSAVNPLNSSGSGASFWSTHLFGNGIDATQVQSTRRTFNDSQPVTLNLASGFSKAPVSQHFGLRSVVTVTQ